MMLDKIISIGVPDAASDIGLSIGSMTYDHMELNAAGDSTNSSSAKEPRKVQENVSLTTKSTSKSCSFLRDLAKTWHTIWHDSAGIVLGILRKHKKILHFCKRPGTEMHVSF